MLGPFGIEDARPRAGDAVSRSRHGVEPRRQLRPPDRRTATLGRWLLIGVGLAGAVLFGWWLWTARRVLAGALARSDHRRRLVQRHRPVASTARSRISSCSISASSSGTSSTSPMCGSWPGWSALLARLGDGAPRKCHGSVRAARRCGIERVSGVARLRLHAIARRIRKVRPMTDAIDTCAALAAMLARLDRARAAACPPRPTAPGRLRKWRSSSETDRRPRRRQEEGADRVPAARTAGHAADVRELRQPVQTALGQQSAVAGRSGQACRGREDLRFRQRARRADSQNMSRRCKPLSAQQCESQPGQPQPVLVEGRRMSSTAYDIVGKGGSQREGVQGGARRLRRATMRTERRYLTDPPLEAARSGADGADRVRRHQEEARQLPDAMVHRRLIHS